MENIDFGQVIKNYASSREDIPTALMDSLMVRGIFLEGKKVVDLGSGTGTLARKIAMRKANVVGVEPSTDMLEQATQLNTTKNFTIPYVQATAENTGLDSSTYDMVTVMRAWHLVDRERAIQEIKRMLKSKGTLIVIDSRLTVSSKLVGNTIDECVKSESKQEINGFPVEWFAEWQQNKFELLDFYKLNDTFKFSMAESQQNVLLKELADVVPDGSPLAIPYECNVCILRLAE